MNKKSAMVLCIILLGSVLLASANQDLFDKGIALLKQSKFADAADAFSELISKEPSNLVAYRNRGVAYMNLNKYDAAISDFEFVLKGGADTDGVYSNLGVAWYYKNNYPKAIYYYNKGIELNSENHYTYFNRSICWTALNEIDKAFKDVEKSLELQSGYYPAICLKADLLLELGQREKALKTYQTAYQLAPDETYAQKALERLEGSVQALESHEKSKPSISVPVKRAAQTPTLPKRVTPQDANSQYTLQAGAFKIKSNAEKRAATIAEKGLPVRILEKENPGGSIWYLVRVGAYESKTQADAALKKTRKILGIDLIIRPYGRL